MRRDDFWQDYFKGEIHPDDATGAGAVSFSILCLEYFDGARSAMKRYGYGKPVKAKDLAREIQRAICEHDLVSEKAMPAMNEFYRYVSRHVTLCEAAVALREAKREFDVAVDRVGLAAYEASQLLERCTAADAPTTDTSNHEHA